MKLEPLKQWICDECGKVINTIEDGWLEWEKSYSNNIKPRNFRIVHHKAASPKAPYGDCYNKSSYISNMQLDYFCGIDGLSRLLTMFRNVENPIELVEIIKRLHLPCYEEAKLYWSEAQEDGYFEGASEEWPYLQNSLKELIKRYGAENSS